MYTPKVLVAIPTYKGKDYIFKENFEAIKGLNYPNYDYIYLDNTEGTSYTSTLRRRGAKATHIPRNGNSRMALANSQNYARHIVQSQNYDYLMFIESDLIPPKDIIQRLLNHNVSVVGALYFLEAPHPDGRKIKIPCTFVSQVSSTGETSTRIIKLHEVAGYLNTGLRKVHGVGLGCTLIRRDIVNQFPFWYDERFIDKHSDVYFFMQLQNKSIAVYQDTNIIVPHYPSLWTDVEDR
jgi:glycosyltransferase involved in cell wall biosynthesis